MSKRLNPIILGLIASNEMDVLEIAEATGVSRQTASEAIRKLHRENLVHISRREGCQQKAFYRAGQGVDAPRNRTLRDIIPELIDSKAMTATEIAEHAGVSRQVAGTIISQLKDAGQKIRIFDWKVQKRGPHIARYIMGEGEDAPRPPPLTNAEKMKRFRATPKGKKTELRCRKRWRKSPAGKEYERKHSEQRWVKQKFANKGVAGFDPLLAAIMGMK